MSSKGQPEFSLIAASETILGLLSCNVTFKDRYLKKMLLKRTKTGRLFLAKTLSGL